MALAVLGRNSSHEGGMQMQNHSWHLILDAGEHFSGHGTPDASTSVEYQLNASVRTFQHQELSIS